MTYYFVETKFLLNTLGNGYHFILAKELHEIVDSILLSNT
jgi:hypothetical protein